jgi:hypothetical protein
MRRNRSILFVFALILVTPIFAQAQQHKGATHPGAAGGHPGAMRPGQHPQAGRMSPEEQMMHEFYQHQLMLMEMMRPSRPYGGGATNSAARSSHSNSNKTKTSGTASSKSAQSNQANGGQTGSPGNGSHQNNRTSGDKSKHATAKSNEAQREKERAKAKSHEPKALAANRATQGADNLAVGHLKTAHGRLRRADADYRGHRVKAMNHIESAIHHLGSTSGLNAGLGMGDTGSIGVGGGNLSQAESDQILHDAIRRLNQAQGSLGTGTTAAAHHRSANSSITEAIQELQIALKIR